MKKSISFLLCGAMMMTGMYCKKDSSAVKEYTNEETVQKMVRDSDFVQLYRGMIEYNARVGATGQVTLFASALGDVKAFNAESRKYFDEMTLRFPIEGEQGLIEKARVVNARYGLAGRKEMELREILVKTVDVIDPLGAGDNSSARTALSCHDQLVRKQLRCDRDMAVAGIETVVVGTVGVLTATGVGAPIAAGIMTFSLLMKFIRHNNCMNDAVIDYKDCSNPD
jgi:hypothetical protein